jgi:hypothetical protein
VRGEHTEAGWAAGRDYHPAMLLAAQVLGVVAGAVALGALAGGRLTRRSLAFAAPLVPAALACVLLGAMLYPAARNAVFEAERRPSIPAEERELVPGKSADADVEFVEWVRSQLEPGETVAVLTDSVRGYQWATYRLLPNMTTSPDRADVLVFYEQEPDEDDYDASGFESPSSFEGDEDFAVARRSR